MNRIDLPHLVWALESLVAGTVVNRIEVDPETERWAKVALQRMLDLPGKCRARGLTRTRRRQRPGAPQSGIQRLRSVSTGRSRLELVADLDLQQVVAAAAARSARTGRTCPACRGRPARAGARPRRANATSEQSRPGAEALRLQRRCSRRAGR